MTIEINPFGFNHPVNQYENFIGRRDEVHQVLSRVLNGWSVSLVGMPKVGTSSLLSCLFLPEIADEFDISLADLLPIYVNLHAFPTATTEQLFGYIVARLETAAQQIRPDLALSSEQSLIVTSQNSNYTVGLHELGERLRKLVDNGLNPVVMIDEVDYAIINKNLDSSFFKWLIQLQEAYFVPIITSSHIAIQSIAEQMDTRDDLLDDMSSKIVVGPMNLLPFSKEEAKLYMQKLPQKLYDDAKLKSLLLAFSGGHPYLLQLACFHAVEQFQIHDQVDLKLLWHELNNQAQPLFEQLWHHAQPVLSPVPDESFKTFSLRSEKEQPWVSFAERVMGVGGILQPAKSEETAPKIFSYAFGQYSLQKRQNLSQELESPAKIKSDLASILSSHFNIAELHNLCFEMGIDFENLAGQEKNTKILELVNYMSRQRRLGELVQVGKQLNPGAPWPH